MKERTSTGFGQQLAEIRQALRARIEELLGTKPLTDTIRPKTARLLKRLRRVEELPPLDQRALLKMLDALVDARRRSSPR